METDKPRESIRAKDVKTRAAAARDLAKIGGWDDLELLVEMATREKSSAVRLYTAAAASDILSRFRGLVGQESLTREQASQVHAWVGGTDPGTNPGMLMMLSAVGDKAAVDRLGRMLKDPRNGVRAGAATALRRMVLSASARDDRYVQEAARGWLQDKKMPPDAVLSLIELAGEAGWTDLAEEVQRAASAGRPHVAASETALARLRARTELSTWHGLWIDEGLDVLEVAPEPRAESWRIIWDSGMAEPGGARETALEGARLRAGPETLRLVWAPRQGEPELRPAIQDSRGTFWRIQGKDLPAAVEARLDDLAGVDPAALRALAGWLAEIEGVAATRARALVLWRAGELGEALALLDDLAAKKPRAEVYWWLGRVRADAGDPKGAIAALDAFLGNAGKKARYRKEAEALRVELG